MSRLEFMKELARLLDDLPREEKIEILKYYNGYFDDAGEENEAAIIEELGSPAKVAASVKAGMDENMAEHMEFTEKGVDDEKTVHEYEERQNQGVRYERKNGGWKALAIVLILVITFPVWIGIVGGLLGLLGGLFGLIVGLCVAALGGLIGFFVSGVACIAGGFARLLFAPLSAVMSIAVGILMLGLGALCVVLCGVIFGKLIPLIFNGIGNLFRWIGRLLHGRSRV